VIFAVPTFKIARIPEDSSNHEWTRMDANKGRTFRVYSQLFFVAFGCGSAALCSLRSLRLRPRPISAP
jgi:hypothetical protein